MAIHGICALHKDWHLVTIDDNLIEKCVGLQRGQPIFTAIASASKFSEAPTDLLSLQILCDLENCKELLSSASPEPHLIMNEGKAK